MRTVRAMKPSSVADVGAVIDLPKYEPTDNDDAVVVDFTPERERRWLEYLRGLPYSGAVSAYIAASAERLWRNIRPVTGTTSVPDAVATETGGIFMSWDRGDHHVEIELMSSGRYDWFYRNRKTGIYGGGEDFPIQVVAPELLSQLMLATS